MTDRITTAQRSALMSRVKQRDTKPELLLRSLLHRLGYRFRLKVPKLPGRPDIIFRPRKKVIFVHGCFWHGHHCKRGNLPSSNEVFWKTKIEGNRVRDARVLADLLALGWSSLVIWECECNDQKIITGKLAKFLKSPKDS
jgi:DNA mismatch endonuclease, patch repair protein